MIRLLIACGLLAAFALPAQSQPPAPGPTVGSQAKQAEKKTQDGKGKEVNPAANALITTIDQSAPADNQAPPQDTASEHQNSAPVSNTPWDANWVIAALTLALFTVAFFEYRLNRATLKAAAANERAWVSLDTLVIEPDGIRGRVVVIGLKNSGRTPARILSANITVRGTVAVPDGGGGETIKSLEALPDDPVYDQGAFAHPALLVAGETARWRHKFSTTTGETFGFLTMDPGSEGNLWIYGFVKYVDIYNPDAPHTYAWAREYDRALSNWTGLFKFAHVAKPKYNTAD